MPDELAGKRGHCPKCKAMVKIGPAAARSSGPAAATTAAQTRVAAAKAEKTAPAPAPAPAPAAASGGDDPIPFDSLEDDNGPTPEIIVREKEGLGAVSGVSGGSAIGMRAHPATDYVANSEGRQLAVPNRLDLLSHYLVVDHKDLIARWQNDGRGWLIRIKHGFCRAATVAQHIPEVGKFLLIEIRVERREDGFHIQSITPFKLKHYNALIRLTHGDDAILAAVTGGATLNDKQKQHVRSIVKSKFLPHIWPEADELLAAIGDEVAEE